MPWVDGDVSLKIKVTAPPEDGKANDAVIRLLASLLGIPKRCVSIANGEHSRQKQVAVVLDEARDAQALMRRLAALLAIEGQGRIALTNV